MAGLLCTEQDVSFPVHSHTLHHLHTLSVICGEVFPTIAFVFGEMAHITSYLLAA